MGVAATGAYVEVFVRRFKGNDRFPTYTPELDYLIRTRQIPSAYVSNLYSGWSDCLYSDWQRMGGVTHNAVLNSGRDFIHNQAYITAAVGVNVLQWAGVTADTASTAVSDITLPSEVVTSDLIRSSSKCTNTHSAGTNTTTATITWTAANTYTSLDKAALFTASSAGIMAHEAYFSATSLASGDQLQLTAHQNLMGKLLDDHAWLDWANN
jgi:hypothetical protein